MNCKTIMLTGDNDEIAQKVATEVGLTGYKASLLPQNKVEEVEELLNSKKIRKYYALLVMVLMMHLF